MAEDRNRAGGVKGRIVVAMSGGVDSSVTAALLVEEGFEVVGITLQLYDHGAAVGKKGACCAGQDIHDAARVAERLGIPHYVLDYESRFRREVIEDFADSYVRGETPIPCVRCNQTVKFRDLLATARDLEADALATGHYVRRIAGPSGPELHRAADDTRDQSYFLFATTREQLEFLRFPLGALQKDETRALARRFDLPVAAKPDSQDICFVPSGSYAGLVEKLRPGALSPGEVVDLEGRVLGDHPGIIHFTVGQRKGLGLSEREPLYVVRLEPETRRVVVGPRASLGARRVPIGALNWLGDHAPAREGMRVMVKLRSAQPPISGTLYVGEGGGGEVALDEPALGIAPGQACVIYEGERMLGGGWIRRA
ncbi:MAG TPA: tRNA 2-thiouridine(34) synthase MnmA [Stellaceae bacterium]|nr:tRNA 2-thiouridine(34) synthase MnmA [Stellaceae bacterium]